MSSHHGTTVIPAKAGIRYAAASVRISPTLRDTGSPLIGERSDAVLRTAMRGDDDRDWRAIIAFLDATSPSFLP
jgi:hypothetical protein